MVCTGYKEVVLGFVHLLALLHYVGGGNQGSKFLRQIGRKGFKEDSGAGSRIVDGHTLTLSGHVGIHILGALVISFVRGSL